MCNTLACFPRPGSDRVLACSGIPECLFPCLISTACWVIYFPLWQRFSVVSGICIGPRVTWCQAFWVISCKLFCREPCWFAWCQLKPQTEGFLVYGFVNFSLVALIRLLGNRFCWTSDSPLELESITQSHPPHIEKVLFSTSLLRLPTSFCLLFLGFPGLKRGVFWRSLSTVRLWALSFPEVN